MVPIDNMFPPMAEVFARARYFFLGGATFWCVALVIWKWKALFQLSKISAKWLPLAVFGIGAIGFIAGGTTIANASYLRIDPTSIAELEFTQIDEEQGVAIGAPRIVNDPAQIQQAFALLGKARPYWRNHESFRNGYVIRIRERGKSDFSGRLIFAYRRSSLGGGSSIVIPSVSRRNGGALVDAGEYASPEFHSWLAKTVDPLFSNSKEAK
jgi:hypothetical protein